MSSSGLDQNQAEAGNDGASGDHTRGTSSWLTGVYPKRTEGADVRNGVSADQIAAPVLGKDTALPSLELAIDLNFLVGQCENSYSCAYLNTLAWTSPTTPLPTENNPRVVFERLFGDGGTAERRAAQARRNHSILDSVLDDLNRLQRQLGPGDRTVVGDYVDAVREVERRISGRRRAQRRRTPDARAADWRPRTLRRAREADVRAAVAGLPRRHHARRHLHARTRVELPHLSGDRRHRRSPRPLASRRIDPSRSPSTRRSARYQAQLFAWFLEKLQATPEGDGTLLDHSLFLYGAGLSNPNTHAHVDLPLLVVGGRSSASTAIVTSSCAVRRR